VSGITHTAVLRGGTWSTSCRAAAPVSQGLDRDHGDVGFRRGLDRRDRDLVPYLQLGDGRAALVMLAAPPASGEEPLGARAAREVVADVLARDHSFFVSQHGSTTLL